MEIHFLSAFFISRKKRPHSIHTLSTDTKLLFAICKRTFYIEAMRRWATSDRKHDSCSLDYHSSEWITIFSFFRSDKNFWSIWDNKAFIYEHKLKWLSSNFWSSLFRSQLHHQLDDYIFLGNHLTYVQLTKLTLNFNN